MQTDRNQATWQRRSTRILQGIQYSIDFLTAGMLLTGQITTVGIYVVPNGFFLAGTGPILGGDRMKGTTLPSGHVLDAIDIINALLLIIGQVRITGPYFTSGRVYLVWTGDIFGLETVEAHLPATAETQALRRYLKAQMLNRQPALRYRTGGDGR